MDGERTTRLLDALRTFGANYTDLTGRFAAWLGLHHTDAAALVEILYAEDQGTPLTPTGLGGRLGLTSGATTNLLNRLEKLGHVVRTREHTDRRVVTLRSSPAIEAPAREFFGPLAGHLGTLVARYSAEQLDLVEDFLDRLRDTMAAALADPPPDRPGAHRADP
ncbi:MarR family winged helix-turn-helix transcriptional regulator [Actinosynnema sp. NPDC050436]|uniref:MarR family winged helix-turn-helix transcriptional regulator n=1 Tax=Actinosynnema sp. NPDC050436 TaxID=3155659 RepID=UPI0033C59605